MPIKVSWVLEMSPLCDWRHIKTMGGESEQFKQFKQQPVIENNNNTPRGAPHYSTTAQQHYSVAGMLVLGASIADTVTLTPVQNLIFDWDTDL